MARPALGEGEGGGGGGGAVEAWLDDDGGGDEEVADVEDRGVFEVVGETLDAPDCISPIIPPSAEVTEAGKAVVLDRPDAAVCMSPTMPARAEVIEAGKAVEPEGNSICVSGQDPSLFA